MKRELYNNVKLIPGGTAVAIDRSGFLSAIVAASVTTAADGQKVAFSVTHCDTQDGVFVAVDDDHIGIDGPLREAAVKTGDISWGANSTLKLRRPRKLPLYMQ